MKDDLEKMIDKEKFQIFIVCCPAYFPFNFFRHLWIVLNKKGEIFRYEIRHYINEKDGSHLFINNQSAFEGIIKFPYLKRKWNVNMLKYLEGDTAQKIIDFVEKTKIVYPYIKNYYFSGPNSNTYINWILKRFPEVELKLSWRFIGKDYK
jgi:hypothetical protein